MSIGPWVVRQNATRILKIERATKNARPTHHNPAWLNTHNDLVFVLENYRLLEKAYADLENELESCGPGGRPND